MYDFTTVLERKGKDSLAADVIPFDQVEIEAGFAPIPMWVADMSFPTAPFILEAMRKRLEVPTFGYFQPSRQYYERIIWWHKYRKGMDDLKKEMIGYENGVLGGIRSSIVAFSAPGEAILVHSPTYIGFTRVLNDLGRTIVYSEMIRDTDGIWRMDYKDMDQKLKENHIHLAIFCSPHNPCGRVWERWEIEKALDVYRRNDCIVISDEIWSDIIRPGFHHIPTQSISPDAKSRTVAYYAPSKTFSLAGMIGAYHVIYNEALKDRVNAAGHATHYNDMNLLTMHALIGAYTEQGSQWVDEMNQIIAENTEYACNFIAANFSGVRVMRPQGTYMLYLDCAEWCRIHGISIQDLLLRGVRKGVVWQNGEIFHMPETIRMNLALPKTQEEEAFRRLKEYVFI